MKINGFRGEGLFVSSLGRHAAAFALFSVLCLAAGRGEASVVADRLGNVARDLTEACLDRDRGAKGSALAVMDFDAPEDLAKRKVNFAVAELLVQEFVRRADFKVVERREIWRVTGEQALGLSGAIDVESAVRVGKLVGAKLLVMGSVHKLGNKYQVNARLVEVETGTVAAAAFQEMNAGLFEEEAKPYIVLVPKRQAVGIFLGAGAGFGGGAEITPLAIQGSENGIDYLVNINEAKRADESRIPAWFGVKFFPWEWLMLEATYEAGVSAEIEYHLTADLAMSGDFLDYATAELSVSGIRLAASYVQSFGERLRAFAGAGAAMYSFQYDTSREDWAASFGTSPNMVNINVQVEGHDSKLLSPFLHCGVEWMLMERWGVSLAGSVSVPAEYLVQHRVEVKDSSGVMVSSFVHDYVVWKTPAAFAGGNVSFYF